MLNGLFYTCRHGKTAGNESGCYRSWSNAPEAQLNAEGKDGVRQSAIFLLKSGLRFPLIISDDLDRAVETRSILAEILEIPQQLTDKRLRPLNVGEFTGKKKTDYPLDKYLANKSLVIPGGESVNQFSKREAEFFDDVSEIVGKLGPILLVAHGSTNSFLHNNFNEGASVGYEGVVHPAGISMFTAKGLVPLTNKRDDAKNPLKDGSPLSGFVTAEENPPPRSCWHCRWVVKDVNGLFGCTNPVVRIDPALQEYMQTDNTIAVAGDSCCDYYAGA